jgi:hypothetical protein
LACSKICSLKAGTSLKLDRSARKLQQLIIEYVCGAEFCSGRTGGLVARRARLAGGEELRGLV